MENEVKNRSTTNKKRINHLDYLNLRYKQPVCEIYQDVTTSRGLYAVVHLVSIRYA